ncbi:hypothetical protein [Protofrankia symbiont of Coriaria ruscifolia]|uniref:Insertion element protein n=1 Tax=Candidatus Protofrankia californiensis TaxID=1839754 RepID=A0A1C3PFU1_9ACTN|nr:hypothetical protein [Protofrankia symbiont of Coriaria ruscifolia]SBW28695.1 hypothetical protein FDG2_5874 [Candidatus Protofrankia californiensis]
MASAHSVPFYCPYCGEEDLVPYLPVGDVSAGSGHGQWSCGSCRRAFRLSLTALAVAVTPAAAHAVPSFEQGVVAATEERR